MVAGVKISVSVRVLILESRASVVLVDLVLVLNYLYIFDCHLYFFNFPSVYLFVAQVQKTVELTIF